MANTADQLDRSLLSLLRRDSRTPVARLAEQTGVSRATVKTRIERMIQAGVILGFTVKLAEADAGVRAMMTVEIQGRSVNPVIRTLLGYPEVRSIHSTNGAWDLVIEIDAADLAMLDGLLRRIRGIDGVARTETSILLRSNHRP